MKVQDHNVKDHHHNVNDHDHDHDVEDRAHHHNDQVRPGRGEDRVVAQLVTRTSRHWRPGVRSVRYDADGNDDADDDDDDDDYDDDDGILSLWEFACNP